MLQLLTFAFSILAAGLAAALLLWRARRSSPARTGLRLAALIAVLGTGGLVGVAVEQMAGSQLGFLAIPGALVVGWWFLANPLACEPAPASRRDSAGP